MSKLILPALLLSLGLPGAGHAQQQAVADVHVSYDDLNLSRSQDIRVLDRRIASAIKAVCPDERSTVIYTKMAAYRCHAAKRAEVAEQRARALSLAGRKAMMASAR